MVSATREEEKAGKERQRQAPLFRFAPTERDFQAFKKSNPALIGKEKEEYKKEIAYFHDRFNQRILLILFMNSCFLYFSWSTVV